VRVFLTGGTGFIGTHLVNALLARGDEVTCLVRSPAKAAGLEARGVRLVRGDLESRAALREGAAGADVVIHLAGVIAARSAGEFIAANRDGTANVLDAAAAHPPRRFVFVSSIAAAGPTVPGRPLVESALPHPVTPYGASKLAGEALVRTASFPWTIVRPPVVYGEWDRATLRIFQLANRGLVPLLGDGSQELSAIHGEDLAAALVTVASAPGSIGKVYFAAHPEITTSRGLALAVGRALGKTPRVLPVPAPVARAVMSVAGMIARIAGRASVLSPERADEFLAPAWTCRPDALRADTGWQATIDLATGLARTAAWYRQEGWLA
jgi:nucleoside-diphosphate-sugar epimerase